ncbi:MAG: crotonyl-CoA carboxylase/reductase [Dehalococcoidia bacterium]
MTTAERQIYELGEAPPVGVLPEKMYAQVIRQSRYGPPISGYQREVISLPKLGPNDVMVYVMAAGINYNGVWASLGTPIDLIRSHRQSGDGGDEVGFHIAGSDASGIVYAVGRDVENVKVGDEVVLHCGMWDKGEEQGPLSTSFKIWGYESNWGSFAQFTKVRSHQCLPKPKHLTWEEAACYMLVAATAYRMLASWEPHTVKKDDPVLIWGGSGGLGSMGIQIAKAMGGIPVAVVSNDERGAFCTNLGAAGYVNRTKFSHWGRLPDWSNEEAMTKAVLGFRAFGKAIWEVLGERRNPRIVFEHSGQDTIPTSLFVCDSGGMVVICAGTTGYNADVDLRYLWMRQKRLQGSHFANNAEAAAVNQMVSDGLIDPCLTHVGAFDDAGLVHQMLYENRHPNGNMAILVGAPRPGMKTL